MRAPEALFSLPSNTVDMARNSVQPGRESFEAVFFRQNTQFYAIRLSSSTIYREKGSLTSALLYFMFIFHDS
jgi:hypothetical protein